MSIYGLLLILLIFFVGIIAVLMTVKYLKLHHQQQMMQLAHVQSNQLYFMERTITERNQTIQNLMDRLMSEDPKTYRVMTSIRENPVSPNSSDTQYVSMSDPAEAYRLVQMTGVGNEIFDHETLAFRADMGIGIDNL